MDNPKLCSYLALFCREQYNAENLNFWIAVDRFKDKYSDPKVWCSSFSDVDVQVSKQPEDFENWPSATVTQEAMETSANDIVDAYLSESAAQQVMLPHVVKTRTEKRLRHLPAYGTTVFDECLIDPIKTMRRDIMPRFIRSPLYQEMLTVKDYQADNRELVTPHPPSSIIDYLSFEDFQGSRTFSLNEIVNDKYLYSVMLKFLQRTFSSENLTCAREIQIYDELLASGELESAKRKALDIYHYYLLPGALFEVSSSCNVRKDIALSLADPQPNMFHEVKAGVLEMLKADYNKFSASQEFAELGVMMRSKYAELRGVKRKSGIFNCLQTNN